MNDYTQPEYKNLYEEILLDYHFRFPKFHPIPYINDNQILHPRNRKATKETH